MTEGVSLASSTEESVASRDLTCAGGLAVRHSLLLALGLTLLAIAADQYAAPILQTTSPLWATAACFLLIWRRDALPRTPGNVAFEHALSKSRMATFFAAHILLIFLARFMTTTFQPAAGTPTVGGALIAVSKLTVLMPTLLLLLPLPHSKGLLAVYKNEIIAALVVLITFSPWRMLQAVWPWYGQVLGRFVYELSRFSVPSLGYVNDLTPTLTGPHLDITIIQACSGINGFELFGYLFGFVTFLDWNRLRKGRALYAYFAGLVAVLVGNALRISSFVVFGNHGFADFVLRFHVSAGWIFFSVIFLLHLLVTYGWMLEKQNATLQPWKTA